MSVADFARIRSFYFDPVVSIPAYRLKFDRKFLTRFVSHTLGYLDLPSTLEQRGFHRTDGKRQDSLNMIPWEMGEQLVWDVTFVDALAPRRLNHGSL